MSTTIESRSRADTRTVPAQNVTTFSLQGMTGAQAEPAVAVPGLGNVTTTFVLAGPSSTQELNLTVTGLHLTTSSPSTVLLQPRQSANQDFGYPDEFAAQLITTAAGQFLIRIRRLDSNSGWGQDLRLDMAIFDSVNNP